MTARGQGNGGDRARLLLASSVLLAAACSGTADVPLRRPPLDPVPALALSADSFPGAAAVLDGFAPPDDDPALRVGDAALLGVEIHRGDEVERVLLLLEVRDLCIPTAEPDGGAKRERPSGVYHHRVTHIDVRNGTETDESIDVDVFPVRVALTRCDAEGRPQQTSEATLFEQAMATGLWPYVIADQTLQKQAFASLCESSLSTLASDDTVLQEMLFRVVERPSLWSIVTNLGIVVTPAWLSDYQAPPIEFTSPKAEARPVTLMLWVNSHVVLWVDLFVAKPNGGTMACAGVVGAVARHPTDPGRTAVVRLLATRRGPPR